MMMSLKSARSSVHAERVMPIQHQKMGCNDEGDDHLYETAIAGGAHFIVSRDTSVLNPPSYVREY
jgi:predicted nucleic acid-binding protein